MSIAEPGSFWKVFVISLTYRTTICCACWNSILSLMRSNNDGESMSLRAASHLCFDFLIGPRLLNDRMQISRDFSKFLGKRETVKRRGFCHSSSSQQFVTIGKVCKNTCVEFVLLVMLHHTLQPLSSRDCSIASQTRTDSGSLQEQLKEKRGTDV